MTLNLPSLYVLWLEEYCQISPNKNKSLNFWHVTSILVCCIFGQTYVTFLNLILQEGGHPTSIVPVIITGLIHGPVWTLIVLEADCLCHQPGVPIIPRPRQDFTGVANCPRPARQVLYETILISYFTQFIYRVIKSIPSPGGIRLSLALHTVSERLKNASEKNREIGGLSFQKKINVKNQKFLMS